MSLFSEMCPEIRNVVTAKHERRFDSHASLDCVVICWNPSVLSHHGCTWRCYLTAWKKDVLLKVTRASVCKNDDVDCECSQSSQIRADRVGCVDWCASAPRWWLEVRVRTSWCPQAKGAHLWNHGRHPVRACKTTDMWTSVCRTGSYVPDPVVTRAKTSSAQIVNSHVPHSGFPAVFCYVSASVFESRYSFSFLSLTSAKICDSIDDQSAWTLKTRKSWTDVRYFDSFDWGVEVTWIIPQEFARKRIGEQIFDVAVSAIQEVIVVVIQPNPQDRISERIVVLLVSQPQKRDVEVVKATPQDRVRWQTVGQFVDVPVPLVLEEIAEVIIDESFAVVPLLRIQIHISAQIDEQTVNMSATTSPTEIAESLQLNPQDSISDCIVEQIVSASLSQDENIEINQEENLELVQPFLWTCSFEDIFVSPPGARPAKKRREENDWEQLQFQKRFVSLNRSPGRAARTDVRKDDWTLRDWDDATGTDSWEWAVTLQPLVRVVTGTSLTRKHTVVFTSAPAGFAWCVHFLRICRWSVWSERLEVQIPVWQEMNRTFFALLRYSIYLFGAAFTLIDREIRYLVLRSCTVHFGAVAAWIHGSKKWRVVTVASPS